MDIGKLGEDLACRFLEQKGFQMKLRNYRRILGELDIIAERRGKIHFVEVKAVSGLVPPKHYVAEGDKTKTGEKPLFKPEDAVHYRKRERLKRAIQSYLLEYRVSDETEWQFDIIAVTIDAEQKQASVRHIENMVL